MIRIFSFGIVFFCSFLISASAHAHLFGHWGGSEVEYACKPHHHGRFLHRCSDERHIGMDISHDHPGLERYYARRPDFYLGAKTGAFSVKNSDYETDGIPMAVLAGYGTYDLSIEIELSRGNVTPADQLNFAPYYRNRGRYDTLAIYGVHKFGGQLYIKAKIGLRKNWAATETGTESNEDLSLGIGIGKNLGRFTLEGEWTALENDVQFSSVGLNYKF